MNKFDCNNKIYISMKYFISVKYISLIIKKNEINGLFIKNKILFHRI